MVTLEVVCILEVFFLSQAFDVVMLYFAEKGKFGWESWGLYRSIVISPYRKRPIISSNSGDSKLDAR